MFLFLFLNYIWKSKIKKVKSSFAEVSIDFSIWQGSLSVNPTLYLGGCIHNKIWRRNFYQWTLLGHRWYPLKPDVRPKWVRTTGPVHAPSENPLDFIGFVKVNDYTLSVYFLRGLIFNLVEWKLFEILSFMLQIWDMLYWPYFQGF